MLLLIFGIGLFLFILSPTSISSKVQKELDETLYLRGLVNTPECFAYEGIGGRVDQKIIDETKLTIPILSQCLEVPVNSGFSDTHAGSIYLREIKKRVNSSQWVEPLIFEDDYLPVFVHKGEETKEDLLFFYLLLN